MKRNRPVTFESVLVQILETEEAGGPVDPAAWYARYPEFRAELEQFFRDESSLTRARDRAQEPPAPAFPGYEVVREVGRGGNGVVFEAREADTGRVVALKALVGAHLLTPIERVRFRREARTAALLDHPHILPVYAAGEADGTPYYTMMLAAGPLSRALDRFRADPKAAAALVAGLARGVHFAHQRGILHRDLKPSNVLLDDAGRGYVSDFGLVRDLADPDPVTRTRELVGTVPYMAPESTVARGGGTLAVDVYGLGGILYACLTGRPPFEGASDADTLIAVRTRPPTPPAARNPRVPRDLDAVCRRCLEKEPAARYPSAADLADDLDRFARGEPVRAKPVGPVRRALRWARRHPVPTALGATAATAVLVAAAVGARAWERERWHRLELRAARDAEDRQRFFAGLERVRQRRGDPYPGWSAETLADVRALTALPAARDHRAALRSEAAAALAALDLVPAGVLDPDRPSYGVDYSPDGRWLAAGRWGSDGGATGVRLYDPATGDVVRDLPIPADAAGTRWEAAAGRGDRVPAVRFSPDVRWLVAGTSSGRLACWDLNDSRARPRVWPAHADPLWTVSFARDGRTVFSGTRNEVRSWDLAGKPAGPAVARVQLPAQSPVDPARVPVTVVGRWEVEFRDLTTGRRHPGPPVQGVAPAAAAPGGRLFVGMSPVSEAPSLWPDGPDARPRPMAADGRVAVRMTAVGGLAFDPAGGLMATVEEHARQVKLWDVAAGRLAAERTTPGDAPRVAVRPDGRRLAVGGRHGVAVYDVPNRVLETVGLVAEPAVTAVAASPDHTELLLTAATDGAVPCRLYWRADRPREWLLDHWSVGPVAAYSPTARVAVYEVDPGAGGDAALAATDGKRWEPRDLQAAAFGPDGRLWILDADGLRESTPPAWADRVAWRNDPDRARAGMVPRCLAVGRDRVAVGLRDGSLVVIDPATGAATDRPLLTTPLAGVAIAPDGRRLVAGGEAGEVRLVDAASGTATEIPEAHRGPVPAVAFGRRFFVTGSADRRVRLWTPAGEPIATLRMAGPVRKTLLSGDGRSLLVLVEGERAVRRWRLDVLFREWASLGLQGEGSGVGADEE
ncbi:MAG TPA: serine/threonine-protein kinase [Gemmataceae bacterium]|nr:serine/threonine-protein kinase [Gemmataceae bacterium]